VCVSLSHANAGYAVRGGSVTITLRLRLQICKYYLKKENDETIQLEYNDKFTTEQRTSTDHTPVVAWVRLSAGCGKIGATTFSLLANSRRWSRPPATPNIAALVQTTRYNMEVAPADMKHVQNGSTCRLKAQHMIETKL